jgi:hypothetical protein
MRPEAVRWFDVTTGAGLITAGLRFSPPYLTAQSIKT